MYTTTRIVHQNDTFLVSVLDLDSITVITLPTSGGSHWQRPFPLTRGNRSCCNSLYTMSIRPTGRASVQRALADTVDQLFGMSLALWPIPAK